MNRPLTPDLQSAHCLPARRQPRGKILARTALVLAGLLVAAGSAHAQTSPLDNLRPPAGSPGKPPSTAPDEAPPPAEPTPAPEEPAGEPAATPGEPVAEPTPVPTPPLPASLAPSLWSTAAPSRVAEQKLNDSQSAAQAIAVPCVVSSTFSEAKASAWYTFEVPPGGAPSLYVALKPGKPTTRGYSLYLHNQTGTLTSSDCFPDGKGEYLTSLALPAGVYFLSVEAGGTETVPFELLVAGVPEVTPEQVGAALNKALDWLVAQQAADGGFESQRGGPGIAGLATQALMNFEGPHRDDSKAIYKALDYVASHYHDPAKLDADNRFRLGGSICKDEGYALYEHGIGLTTLLEAYMLGVDDTTKPLIEAAIGYTLAAQLSTERPAGLNSPVAADCEALGGWRYEATAADADLSVTGWQAISLFTAKKAGFTVPAARLDLAKNYVRRCYIPDLRQFGYQAGDHGTSPGRSAMGALSLQILGVGADDPMVRDGLRHMLTQAPTWEGEPGMFPFYYWFYGTRAAFLAGGDTWKLFKSCIQSLLVHHQDPAGTWQRNCKEVDDTDDVYVTALGALMLEICAGHLPPYLRQGTVPKRVLPPRVPPLEVDLTCVVTDETNNYIMDLNQQDFAVTEDGVPQTVVRFGSELKPVSLALVLDDSGSLKRSVEEVKSAAERFVSLLQPSDRAMVVVFANEAKMVQDFTADQASLTDAVKTLRAKGGTALYDAICLACGKLQPVGGRTAVIVLTDGKDENDPGTAPGSKHTLDQTIRAAKEAGVTVFALGLGTKVTKQVLGDLAKETGGRAYFPPTAEDLAEVYDLIVKELRSQYTVGYTSTNPTRDGKWRAVEVTVPDKPYAVRTRKGFFAK